MSSLSKVLAVLDLFGPDRLRLDVESIAEAMGLSRATAYRYVKDLCASGLLTRISTGNYGLGPRIIELDWMMRQYDSVLVAGRELIHTLSDETGLAVFVSVFYDGHIINTYIAEPNNTYRFSFGRGRPLPLFRGAQSKVLIAHQTGYRLKKLFEEHIAHDVEHDLNWLEFNKMVKKIRKEGYCITHNELNQGLTGIAAPIISLEDGEVLGSLSVVGNSANFKLLKIEAVIEMVVETTRQIATKMQALS